jgi:hypothetical protein
MHMNTVKEVFLIRGLPGSGKSTLARALKTGPSVCHFEADNYFVNSETGEYKFDPTKLTLAHKQCQALYLSALANPHVERVIVSNTFSQWREIEFYVRHARDGLHTLTVIDLFNGGLSIDELVTRNVHRVPLETIRAMYHRWHTGLVYDMEEAFTQPKKS